MASLAGRGSTWWWGGQPSGEHRRGPQKGRLPHYSCPIAGVEVCHLASLVRSKLPMFDSSFFLARTEEGVVAPARLGQDGRYHVEGESVFAPKDLLVPALKTMAKEIFMEAKAFNKIIMSLCRDA